MRYNNNNHNYQFFLFCDNSCLDVYDSISTYTYCKEDIYEYKAPTLKQYPFMLQIMKKHYIEEPKRMLERGIQTKQKMTLNN